MKYVEYFKTAKVKINKSSFGDIQQGNDSRVAFKTAENERDDSGDSEDDEGLKEEYKGMTLMVIKII